MPPVSAVSSVQRNSVLPFSKNLEYISEHLITYPHFEKKFHSIVTVSYYSLLTRTNLSRVLLLLWLDVGAHALILYSFVKEGSPELKENIFCLLLNKSITYNKLNC